MGNCLSKQNESLTDVTRISGKLNCFGAIDEEPSPLFQPGMKVPLVKILNYTDPRIFATLLKTNKKMRKFCLETKDLKIPLKNVDLWCEQRKKRQTVITVSKSQKGLKKEHLEDLRRLPFVLYVECFYFSKMLDARRMAAVSDFLAQYPVQTIDSIIIFKGFDLEHLLVLMKTYSVKRLKFLGPFYTTNFYEGISNIELDFFGSSWDVTSSSFLAITSIPELKLSLTPASTSNLSVIIKRFLEGLYVKNWQLSPEDNEEVCAAFLKFKTLPLNYEGELPSIRPLVFAQPSTNHGQLTTTFWVLREDGAILFCGEAEEETDCVYVTIVYFAIGIVEELGQIPPRLM